MSRWRNGFAVFATFALSLALLVELGAHLLGSFGVDTVSDPLWVAGIALLALSPWVVQAVLVPASLRPWQDRVLGAWLGLALAFGMALGLAVWPSYCVSAMGIASAVLLITLPIVPFALLGISPLVATMVVLFQSIEALRERRGARLPFVLAAGVGLGLFVVRPVLIGRAMRAAMHATDVVSRERALSQLRRLGAAADVRSLKDGYPPTASRVIGGGGWGSGIGSVVFSPFESRPSGYEDADRLYFLMTGDASSPKWGGTSWDPRHGSQRAGEKQPGLSLQSSAQEVRYSPSSQTAQSLWTLTFANDALFDQEARAGLSLPEGCVISDAWLWIDGKPRPAAFTSKGKAVEAYRAIAVAERKDPLLVTSVDPRHAFLQCFPVPAGKTMQVRLQLTHAALGGRFVPATLGETNFEDRPTEVRVNGKAFAGETLPAGPLTLPRGIVAGSPPKPEPIALSVALDPSAAVGRALDPAALVAAVRRLPAGSTVRFVDTRRNTSTAWLASTDVTRAFVDGLHFAGGVDPFAALADLHAPTPLPSAILWIHGAVPEEAGDAEPVLAARKSGALPALVSLQVEPGDNTLADAARDPRVQLMDGSDVAAAVQRASQSAPTPRYDPKRVPLGGREPAIGGLYVTPEARTDEPGDWPRLAAASRILALWSARAKDTSLARAAATRRLITPVSGAVVLESKEQYDRFGLNPKREKAEAIPGATPEPGETAAFAVLAVGLCALVALKKLRRRP